MIQFLVNQELHSEHALDPNMTVLQYLREHLANPAPKSCASGDCGACTVVVGELSQDEQGNDSLRYRSLNSCLTFVSSLHGKQLISVEGSSIRANCTACNRPWPTAMAHNALLHPWLCHVAVRLAKKQQRPGPAPGPGSPGR